MNRKFSLAIVVALMVGMSLPSMVLAATPTAHVLFTTDAPCAVTVLVTSYTDPNGNQSGMPTGSTPWTLDTAPSTSVSFVYPKAITCSGVSYVWQSTTPGNPITSGADGTTTTVTGYYVVDKAAPVWTVPSNFSVEATESAGAVVTYTATATDPSGLDSQSCLPASGTIFALGTTTVHCTATDTNGNTGTASFDVTVVDTTPPSLTLPTDITTSASSPSGKVVDFTASATDLVDGSVTVTCSPASGSTFAVGTTTVNCSATDAHKNTANGSFKVTITFTDNTLPTVTVPADITAEATGPSGAVVNFTVSANDNVDGPLTPTCLPASGSTFTLGTSTVICSATDSHGNTGTASFHVNVVDTTKPTLHLPQNITVDTTDAAGTTVNFSASATDLVDGSVSVTCIPASGSIFPIGQTTVNCSATDAHQNTANGSFTVTVTLSIITDLTPPVWTVPSDFSVEATGPNGAIVTYSASATDPDDVVNSQACLPASGSTFALGTTAVNCSATDTHGNTGTASFNITVVDTTAPTLNLPADMTVDATSPAGAMVNFTASAADLVDGSVAVTCSPASGSTFPFGTTTVNCSATDAHNNTANGSFTVTVVDQTPPVLNLPGDMTVTALNASGAKVNFSASATDAVDGSVAVTCSPAFGSWFPIGVTMVNCSAVDSHGNQANGSFTVAVQYAGSEVKCNGVPGHQILQPINSDGSSVFKQGSTVPVKFRVCGSDGKAISNPGVVTGFTLLNDRAEILSTNGDTTFRSGNAQWIFNLDTKNLTAGNTYIYLITLNDGSTIQFQFTLK